MSKTFRNRGNSYKVFCGGLNKIVYCRGHPSLFYLPPKSGFDGIDATLVFPSVVARHLPYGPPLSAVLHRCQLTEPSIATPQPENNDRSVFGLYFSLSRIGYRGNKLQRFTRYLVFSPSPAWFLHLSFIAFVWVAISIVFAF